MAARSLLRWWRAPWWLLALATGSKSFLDNPIIGSETLNRRGLHTGRLKLAHHLAWRRRRRLAADVPESWRDQFDRDGFVAIPDFLPQDVFSRLQSRLLTGSFDARAQLQGDTVTRRVPLDGRMLEKVPELRSLIESRMWKSLLAYVASTRSEPLYYLQTISIGKNKSAPDPQLELHSDTFHPSLKAWLFLTDVTNDQSALTYVPGSHLLTSERLAWEKERSITIAKADRLSQRGSFRISAEELPALGLGPPRRFAVPANTLVVVDTCGFHARGPSTEPVVRVELWAYSRRNPFLLWTGLDLLSWKPLVRRREAWLLRAVDLLDRLGLRKQVWRPEGRRNPLEP